MTAPLNVAAVRAEWESFEHTEYNLARFASRHTDALLDHADELQRALRRIAVGGAGPDPALFAQAVLDECVTP